MVKLFHVCLIISAILMIKLYSTSAEESEHHIREKRWTNGLCNIACCAVPWQDCSVCKSKPDYEASAVCGKGYVCTCK
uniref:Uncharacterized protein n=1 Tax=Panagrolaimus sp. PS1159 TaxID=55785 RepID=A0AC35ESW6_9BILA